MICKKKKINFVKKTNSIFITTKQKPKFIIHFYKEKSTKKPPKYFQNCKYCNEEGRIDKSLSINDNLQLAKQEKFYFHNRKFKSNDSLMYETR